MVLALGSGVALCLGAGPAAAQSRGRQALGAADPGALLTAPEVQAVLVPPLCANLYLRQQLARSYAQVGRQDRGAERMLNCFERPGRQLRASVADLLAALDAACPGADVRLWIGQPATLPPRGCGDTYTPPDLGVTPQP